MASYNPYVHHQDSIRKWWDRKRFIDAINAMNESRKEIRGLTWLKENRKGRTMTVDVCSDTPESVIRSCLNSCFSQMVEILNADLMHQISEIKSLKFNGAMRASSLAIWQSQIRALEIAVLSDLKKLKRDPDAMIHLFKTACTLQDICDDEARAILRRAGVKD
jgi:hypothetical protein